jgi:hypothetical protein
MLTDALGYLAASLVFATFCAQRMVSLRSIAIASNLAFIGYGYLDALWPIVVLHGAMLPINVVRCRQLMRDATDTKQVATSARWHRLLPTSTPLVAKLAAGRTKKASRQRSPAGRVPWRGQRPTPTGGRWPFGVAFDGLPQPRARLCLAAHCSDASAEPLS